MKMKIIPALAIALLTAACHSNTRESDNNSLSNIDIRGQWDIENITLSKTESLNPAKLTPDTRQYFIFNDSSYSIRTNCNTISGPYRRNGSDIQVEPLIMTRMACISMATEDALCKLLPRIEKLSVKSKDVIKLCGKEPSEYIILRKSTNEE